MADGCYAYGHRGRMREKLAKEIAFWRGLKSEKEKEEDDKRYNWYKASWEK